MLAYSVPHMGVAKGESSGSWDPPNPDPLKIVKDKTCKHYACTAH